MEFLQSRWISCVLISIFILDSLYALRCDNVKIPNGRARVKGKGRYIEFKCNRNFELVGVKFAVCLATGQWSKNIPSCVGTACQPPVLPTELIVETQYKGGLLKFSCAAGLTRSGPETIMCDGNKWTSQPPKCIEAVTLDCDFENVDLCGWNQDDTDDFDWTWHQGETQTANTGPQFDHTTKSSEGHYLFMESSAPQKTGQRTRLISPPHAASNTGAVCLEFFYHMFGPEGIGEVGNLDVYIRPQSLDNNSLAPATSIFHRSGNQGDRWIHAQLELPQQTDVFNIVFQGTRLKSWSGDIAIDDITVFPCSRNSTKSSGSTNVDTTTKVVDSNNESYYESMESRKPTYRSTTTTVTSVSVSKKTKLPKPTSRSSFTQRPFTNAVSLAAAVTRASKPPKKLSTPSPFISTSPKSPLSSTNTSRDTANKTTDLFFSTTSFLSSTKRLESENSFERYNSSTERYNGNDTNTGLFPDDSITINSDSVSSKNEPVGKNYSKTSFTDDDDATADSSEEFQVDELMDDAADISDNSSPPSSIALLPLIVGIVASVLVGIAVTVIMACIWVRSQRTKQDKHQEDQMNIMSDYIETNLCT